MADAPSHINQQDRATMSELISTSAMRVHPNHVATVSDLLVVMSAMSETLKDQYKELAARQRKIDRYSTMLANAGELLAAMTQAALDPEGTL